ncbi:Piwi-like protein 1 [Thelohanellus kitauei]|uniref:Piwi-like protein 1 n=1 Tax=Thelohanellus kitauei TaxID=669202 RepID=A0A0C2NBU3_THEKT|nr:Piwi-like protein 1 [Thelohanellus kitauei]
MFATILNPNETRGWDLYFSRATRQPAKTEVADSLNVNMKAALDAYYKLNRGLPDAIYVFRDGVGDGQLELVKLQEIPAVLARLEAIYADYGSTPTLAYIIVRKRINTRLFSKVQNEAVNPIPGSIVDRVVTKDDYPNYYLISQKVTQGTVNPTHYIVLHNNTRLPTNNLQRLSYKLCHLYFNWTGTVRVPAPCQYAHKLCFLVSQSIKKEPSNALSNLLYYL